MDGVLVIDKPIGPSSHDVVVVARRSLGISRIGHTGTLDPRASGVLPLVLGQATRLAQYLTGSDKEYVARIQFGLVTDSYDGAGEVVARSEAVPGYDELQAALQRFRGAFEQTPPAFSAKMVGGERSYVRARAGKTVQSPAVTVVAHVLELLEYVPPFARVRVRCSAGFYVRSLAHDLGQAVGTGAILEALVRTEAAGFDTRDAMSFDRLVTAPRAELHGLVRPMSTLLADVPVASLTPEGVDWALHGRELGVRQLTTPLTSVPDRVRLIGPDGQLVGLAERSKMPGFLHPAVIFSYN